MRNSLTGNGTSDCGYGERHGIQEEQTIELVGVEAGFGANTGTGARLSTGTARP